MCAWNSEDVTVHIENSRTLTQWCHNFSLTHGYMVGTVLQFACFLVGTDASIGAIQATMVADSKNMDMPYVVARTAKWLHVISGTKASVCTETTKGILQLLLEKVAK